MADRNTRPVKHMKTLFAKKICLTLAAILCLGVLSACGGTGANDKTGQKSGGSQGSTPGQGGAISEGTGARTVFDIFSDKKQVLAVEKEDLNGTLTGIQFYQGEPVMLSARENSADGKKTCDIYLYRRDEDAKLIAQGLPPEVRRNSGRGFLGEDGCYYHIAGGTTGSDAAVITKYDGSGEKIFSVTRNAVNLQMCSLADGKILMLYGDASKQVNISNGNISYQDFLDHKNILECLDTTTGTVSEIELQDATEYNVWLGTDGTDPYLLDSNGFSRVDPATGEITMQIPFSGSSYGLDHPAAMEGGNICGFQIDENKDAELLWGRQLASTLSASLNVPPGTAWLETIQRRELDSEKTFLTIRGLYMNDAWLKKKIAEFNNRSSHYYVLVEYCPDEILEEDYITRTLVELGTGKGPDILLGRSILGDSLYSLTEKGVLEDLSPYMERSGMNREEYFPLAFESCSDGEKIYEIIFEIQTVTQTVDSRLFEDTGSVNIHTFLDALLSLGAEAVYQENASAADLLQDFLEGSESLWGMVDWERGTCNFETDLFAKLLQVVKNLGDNDKKSYIPVSKKEYYSTFFSFVNNRSQMSKSQVVLGRLFDDGCHGTASTIFSCLHLNANSQNKEGAWEFMSYLLSKDVQETLDYLPVYREAFAAQAETQMAKEAKYGTSKTTTPLTREAVAELETYLLEDIRFPSIRIQPLIDIIKGEAQDYFDGIKSIDQVRAVVTNRVQLYLDEKH